MPPYTHLSTPSPIASLLDTTLKRKSHLLVYGRSILVSVKLPASTWRYLWVCNLLSTPLLDSTMLMHLPQIFEKRSLDTGFRRERGASKSDTEKVYELLKREVRRQGLANARPLVTCLWYLLCIQGEQLGTFTTSFHPRSSRACIWITIIDCFCHRTIAWHAITLAQDGKQLLIFEIWYHIWNRWAWGI